MEADKGKGKVASASTTPTLTMTSKDPTPAMDPSLFIPQDKARQDKLQREKPVWKYAEQGQEAGDKGRAEYWLHEIPKGGVMQTETTKVEDEVPAYLEPQPPPTAGRAAPPSDVGTLHKENGLAAGGGEASGSNTRLSSLQQSTIRRWVDNDAQKKLDIEWAEAMFRVGIPFNFLNVETTQELHEVYLQVANSRPRVKLASFKHIRTVMLDIVYMRVQKTVEPLTTSWDVSGCTFITDGSSDRRERPVMNFLAAGVDGAVFVATVSMSGRNKIGPALAKLREQIMREIGLRGINAICTDNVEVSKRVVQILERRTDKEIARILWVPCAAHCCSLLLCDLGKLDWVKNTVKRGHAIVKFIKNHHSTHSLMMTVDDSLSLLRLMEVRFGSVYQLLERVHNKRAVLKDMVNGRNAAKWNAIRDLDGKLWKGKWGLLEGSSGSEEEADDDSDFELRPEPAVPGTTYVGKRRTGQQRREGPRPKVMEPGVRETKPYNPQSDVEFARLDTDVETLLQTRVDTDEEDANRSKAMADRETELVNKRMMEEEARRAAIPTSREIERGLKQAREHQQQVNWALEVVEDGEEEEEEHQAEVGDAMEQEVEAEGMVQPEEGEEMEHQEEEEGTVQDGEEEEMWPEEEGDGLAQQQVQHGEVDMAREEEPHPTATTVYTRRPRPAEIPESEEKIPEFPPMKEAVQHDNLWVSRVGRKRKEPSQDAPAQSKRPRGRPRKPKTDATTTTAEKKKQRRKRKTVVEDDPESADCSEQPSEDEGRGADPE
ncbi:hypothetical protein CBR_g18635 [Chara braunii]|uniref:DUF659 domain-containing protein n=1 Tax=Chara braunii TaxID=69332 RepID=A0A388JTC3_CHABU|nr:hypothetical protein CBR_g18635 [Chara braunii]|eukprot:GBG61040.1 hypothetical protein CBR_g18635 [Chara braunii]